MHCTQHCRIAGKVSGILRWQTPGTDCWSCDKTSSDGSVVREGDLERGMRIGGDPKFDQLCFRPES